MKLICVGTQFPIPDSCAFCLVLLPHENSYLKLLPHSILDLHDITG